MTQYELLLKRARLRIEELERGNHIDIAVIGMSCDFPGGANTIKNFWDLLIKGNSGIVNIPLSRWDLSEYYDSNSQAPGKMYTKKGGFINNISHFDPSFFNITKREADAMDPQQRLLLKQTWYALENACINPQSLETTKTGVFIGYSWHDYDKISNGTDPYKINAYSGLGNMQSVAIGRLAYFLGINGPTMLIDTACSSSLVSIHQAVKSLRNRESSLAIAGGVSLMLSPLSTIFCCKLNALSPNDQCRVFDDAANGYVRGEGCGIVILKRLSDAVACSDNILAVIKGSAVNHNGRSGGLTVPNRQAQVELHELALRDAKLTIDDIQYIETHGTGTKLGDPIEILAINDVYQDRENGRHPLYVGSVKANIGHLEAAAGIAGFIKAVLMLQHQAVPEQINIEKLNTRISWNEKIKIAANNNIPCNDLNNIGVSSFGISGTNSHVILQRPIHRPGKGCPKSQLYLIALSSKNVKSLISLSKKYLTFIQSFEDINLAELEYSLLMGRSHFNEKICFLIEDHIDLRNQLTDYRDTKQNMYFDSAKKFDSTKLVFIFTEKSMHCLQIVHWLHKRSDYVKNIVDLMHDEVNKLVNIDIHEIVFNANDSRLTKESDHAQLLNFVFAYAIAKWLMKLNIVPDLFIGHGLGLIVAACIANVFDFKTALKIILRQEEFIRLYNKSKHLKDETESEFLIYLQSLSFQPPRIPIFTNLNGQFEEFDFSSTNLKFSFLGQANSKYSINNLKNTNCNIFLAFGACSDFISYTEKLTDNNMLLLSLFDHNSNIFTKGILNAIMSLYLQGYDIDWKYYVMQAQPFKTGSLPNYVFDDVHCWVDASTTAREVIHSMQLDQSCLNFKENHKIFEHYVCPGTGFIMFMNEALKSIDIYNWKALEAKYIQPLILEKNKQIKIELKLMNKSIFVNIYSFDADVNNIKILHYQSKCEKINLKSSPLSIKFNTNKLNELCSPDKLYQMLSSSGLQLKNNFKLITNIYKNEENIIVKIKNPSDKNITMIDAGVLDSCLQASYLCTENTQGQDLTIPVGFESLLYRDYYVSNHLWAVITKRKVNNYEKNYFQVDVNIFTDKLENIISFGGIKYKLFSKNNYDFLSPVSKILTYEIINEKIELNVEQKASRKNLLTLIFVPESDKDLRSVLSVKYHNVFYIHFGDTYTILNKNHATINPIQSEHYSDLFEYINKKFNSTSFSVYYYYNYTLRNNIFLVDQLKITKACFNLICVLRYLKNQNHMKLIQFVAYAKGDFFNYSIIKKFVLENPEYMNKLFCIDIHKNKKTIPLIEDLYSISSDINILYSDLGYSIKKLQIQNGFNITPCFPSQLYAKISTDYFSGKFNDQLAVYKNQILDKNGFYIITGGTSDLGLLIALLLALMGAKHLILISRTGIIDNKQAIVSAIKDMNVSVEIFAADISKTTEVYEIVDYITNRGFVLKGIIHLAGVVHDSTFDNITYEQVKEVFAGKVNGAINLHKATEKMDLDFLICFASSAPYFSSKGQTVYSAANFGLVSLMESRNKMGKVGLCLSFGPIEIGMTKKLLKASILRIHKEGLSLLKISDVLQYTSYFISENINQGNYVIVNTNDNDLISTKELPIDVDNSIKNTKTGVYEFIYKIVSDLTGFDEAAISDSTGLFDIGFDSLMAIDFITILTNQFSIKLDITLVFNYPTIASLSEYIWDKVSLERKQ